MSIPSNEVLKDERTLKLCSGRCNQCLFTKNRIVDKSRVKDLIKGSLKADSYFECHKGSVAGVRLCCRGFWDKYKNDTLCLRLAQMLKNVVELDANILADVLKERGISKQS